MRTTERFPHNRSSGKTGAVNGNKGVCTMASWSPTGVVDALVVDGHAIDRVRSLNAEPKYGGAFHFDVIELKVGPGLVREAFRAVHAARKNYGSELFGPRIGSDV